MPLKRGADVSFVRAPLGAVPLPVFELLRPSNTQPQLRAYRPAYLNSTMANARWVPLNIATAPEADSQIGVEQDERYSNMMSRAASEDTLRSAPATVLGPSARAIKQYHVFVASPGDVNDERQEVRAFFGAYNLNYAEPRGVRFEVVDWENYSSAGVGRPQELITQQTLERYRESLALIVGIMAQRFGSNSGTHESGTEEEFEWAVKSHAEFGFPEVKWFFRNVDKLAVDPSDPEAGLAQWKKVQAFRKRVEAGKTVYYLSYKDLAAFRALLEKDVGRWLNSPDRPWSTPDPIPNATGTGWPTHVVQQLSAQLGDDFAFHMQAGEELSPDQARARYIQGILKLRRGRSSASGASKSHEHPAGMEGPLEDFLASDGVQLLVIGAGGSGKTTMLQHLAAEGARRAVQDPRAPVFVYGRLASFDRGDGGFDLLLDRLSLAARLDRKEFEVLWREGRRPITFLLDGLNEVAQAYQASCTQALWTVLQNSPPVHRYVITSRPGVEFEVGSARSTEYKRLQLADVLEFGPQQVELYLKAQGQTDLQSRISGRLESLASNPFLLWAITRTLAGSQGRGAKNRGSLFRSLVDGYIFEERERSKPSPRPISYNYELVKKPILAKLALKMIEDGVTVAPNAAELRQQVSKYLVDLEREHYRRLPLETETFMPEDYSAVAFLRETVSNGVLVRNGDLRFMHESVQEYFAALALDTATVEDLVRRAPNLKLASLDARGPVFETLVTWAGLSTPENVAALVKRLQDKHLLLAAHLASEAGLPDAELRQLRKRFLSFTASEHEQHRRLGAMGLAIVPSDEPPVVACLVAMLGDGEASDIAEKTLKANPTPSVLAALAKAWTTSSNDVHSSEAKLLRDLATERARAIVEVLLDTWTAQDSRRDRVAELAAFLDAKESWENDRLPVIRETMLTLSVEAELAGNSQRSVDVAALRQRAEETPVLPPGIGSLTDQLEKTIERLNTWERERKALAAAYADKEDAALNLLARDGEQVQRTAALEILVDRRAPSAVAPIVQIVLNNSQEKWFDALATLPREAVQQHLAKQIETLDGELLERARLLAGLVADEPQRTVLETVFRDSGKELRTFAVRAAARAGTEGVELLIRQLDNEASEQVLEGCIRGLGESRSPLAVTHLLDLLFAPTSRQHWPRPRKYEELVSDNETHSGIHSDGWAVLIHSALANAGAIDQTLERLERQMRSARSADLHHSVEAVHEARRCLPAPLAFELLNGAMADPNSAVRLWARWSLACTGDAAAWRALLEAELETPDFFGFAQDAGRRLATTATEPATRDPLIAASHAVLRAALADSDERRRASALELTRRLPEQWVEPAWRREALATAELLFQSAETDQRVRAVRALHCFAADGPDRVFTILLNSSDEAVTQCAYDILGDAAAARLEEHLQSALQVGDAAAAQHIARIVGTVLRYSRKFDAIRDSTGKWVDTEGPDQCVAALLALAVLHPDHGVGEEWTGLSKRARTGFERHGLEETWRRFAVHARSLGKGHRKFIYLVLDAFVDELEQLTFLATRAAELWPDDLPIMGACISVDIRRGNREQAAERLLAVERQFHDSVNHDWLGDRFSDLDRPRDTLRHYRIAAEREPANDNAHFKVGWFAFVTGDLEGSIEATRRSLNLRPTNAMSEFNLGLALLARGDPPAAEAAYRRGIALAKRQAPTFARQTLEGALGDFALLGDLSDATKDALHRIRGWLQGERDHLEPDKGMRVQR